jgi:hypothetical protein
LFAVQILMIEAFEIARAYHTDRQRKRTSSNSYADSNILQ